MKNILNRVTGALLLLLFVGYYVSSTLFLHTHQTTNGVITHSHPYSTTTEHTHTAAEIQLIEHLSSIIFVVFCVVSIGGLLPILCHSVRDFMVEGYTIESVLALSSRGPPQCF